MLLNLNRTNVYQAFGLRIYSEISLPELLQTNAVEDEAIVIERADLFKQWNELAGTDKSFIAKNNFVMFKVTDTAIYSVQDGSKIDVCPLPGANEDRIRLFILGTCMSILLMQRKVLPLHGSAIAIHGKAYAIVGERGAGKSTLATVLLSRGYQLLSDDVIPVSLSEEHIPYVIPSYPQQKLWQESMNHFGMSTEDYRPLFERETKFAIPVASKFSSTPLPLAGIFELIKSESEIIRMNHIEMLDRLHTLYAHTFRQFLIPRLGLLEWHFNYIARFASRIEMNRIHRPSANFTAHQLADLILSTIDEEKNDD